MRNTRRDLEQALQKSVAIGEVEPRSSTEQLVDMLEEQLAHYCKCGNEIFASERFCSSCGLKNEIFDPQSEHPLAGSWCKDNHQSLVDQDDEEQQYCSYCGVKLL